MKYLGTKTLITNRLILRKVQNDDYIQAYKNWCNSDNVVKYVLWDKHKNEEETRLLYNKWIEEYDDKTFRWIIEIKQLKEVVGTIDISKKYLKYGTCGLGYCLSDKYWNKGIMTEAVKAVIKYLFEECEAELIYGEFLENNIASGKVMLKSGLCYEGKFRSRIIDKENNRNDLITYSILKSEYYNQIKKD